MVSVHEQGLKSRRAEELFSILHTMPCIFIQHLLIKSLLAFSILPLFTVSVLFYRFLSYFQDHLHLRDRQRGSDKHRQPTISLIAFKKCCDAILFYLSWSLHLFIPDRMRQQSAILPRGKEIQVEGKR